MYFVKHGSTEIPHSIRVRLESIVFQKLLIIYMLFGISPIFVYYPRFYAFRYALSMLTIYTYNRISLHKIKINDHDSN